MRFYRPFAPVHAITFDLDDTLYDNEPVIRKAEGKLQAHIGERFPKAAAMSPQDWQSIKRDLIAQTPELASDMGQLRLLTLKSALQHDVHGDELDRAASECFDCFYDARSELTLADDVHDTLRDLAAVVPLIGITNGNVNADKIGISSYFSTIYHASLTRPMKPSRAMFDEAASELGLAPKRILHVGDHLIKDVYAAIRAGYQAAWYACNRSMQLNEEPVKALPHVHLDSLSELLSLVRATRT